MSDMDDVRAIVQKMQDREDTITRLRSEVERLTGERDRQYDQNAEQITRIAALEAEVERLRRCLSKQPNTYMIVYEDGDHERLARAACDLQDEVERLREALEDITGAGEEAWGPDRPCVKLARAALEEKP